MAMIQQDKKISFDLVVYIFFYCSLSMMDLVTLNGPGNLMGRKDLVFLKKI